MIKKGDKVNVYLDPITVSDLEGVGTVMTNPTRDGGKDVNGNELLRCCVQFDNEHERYFRTVSELAT